MVIAATTTSGPAFPVHASAAWLITAGAVAFALTTLGGLSAAAWKIVRVAVRFEQKWPILDQIATQFAPDHGHTLHDRIVHIETLQNEQMVQLRKLDLQARKLDVQTDKIDNLAAQVARGTDGVGGQQ